MKEVHLIRHKNIVTASFTIGNTYSSVVSIFLAVPSIVWQYAALNFVMI